MSILPDGSRYVESRLILPKLIQTSDLLQDPSAHPGLGRWQVGRFPSLLEPRQIVCPLLASTYQKVAARQLVWVSEP